MDANSTPPLKIHLPTGSSLPIRAPLTIDSDSEFCLSINDHICSTTSSFNSTSSIDLNFLEENDIFVAHPDEKMVIESCHVEQHSFIRPFVKYPDENYVKNSSHFDKSAIFRPFVKYPDENYVKNSNHFDKSAIFRPFVKYPDENYVKSSNHFDKSAIFRPFVKTPNQQISRVGVPIAPLTSDCDDSDNDSVESRRSLSSDGIPADGNVEKVVMVPKVGVFCSSYEGDDELQFDDVFSGDDSGESNEPITGFVRDETIDEDEDKIEGLKISEMDEIGHYEQKEVDEDEDEDDTSIDSHIVLDSDNDIKIEIETSDEIEQGVFDRDRNEFEKTNEKERDEDGRSIDSHIAAELDNEIKIEIETIDEIEQGVFDRYGNESKKTNEKEEEQREEDEDDIIFDSQRIDSQVIPDSDNKIKIKIENINGIDQEGVFNHFSKSQKILGENEEEMLVKLKPIQAKFLKLVRLLGLSNKDPTVTQLLYRLNLGKPLVVEADGNEFDFSLTILVIGKTGTGKSAIINSIFCENKASTDAVGPGTTTVQEIIGEINGIRVKILDTPGLRDSPSERSHNRKVLDSIKRFTRKRTLDFVLYVYRLDTHSRDLHDSHLLRLITSSLGSLVWQNCIVVLTHAANCSSSSLPDEQSSGFVFQRCRFIQEQIVHVRATGQQTANPVWLVENQNRSSYKHDKDWQTQFLLLCYSAKILDEASSVVGPSLNSIERGWFEFGDRLGHVSDMDLRLEGLMGLDRVWPVEPLGDLWNGGKLSRERKKVCLEDYGFRVKVFGMNRWSLVCRLHF